MYQAAHLGDRRFGAALPAKLTTFDGWHPGDSASRGRHPPGPAELEERATDFA